MPSCNICEEFQITAGSRGYISAASLEDYICQHVLAETQKKGREQHPLTRTAHYGDTPLAYYNAKELSDEVPFMFEDGQCQQVPISAFPESLAQFQEIVHSSVKSNLFLYLDIDCSNPELYDPTNTCQQTSWPTLYRHITNTCIFKTNHSFHKRRTECYKAWNLHIYVTVTSEKIP